MLRTHLGRAGHVLDYHERYSREPKKKGAVLALNDRGAVIFDDVSLEDLNRDNVARSA